MPNLTHKFMPLTIGTHPDHMAIYHGKRQLATVSRELEADTIRIKTTYKEEVGKYTKTRVKDYVMGIWG